jgi:hypothetical protein
MNGTNEAQSIKIKDLRVIALVWFLLKVTIIYLEMSPLEHWSI